MSWRIRTQFQVGDLGGQGAGSRMEVHVLLPVSQSADPAGPSHSHRDLVGGAADTRHLLHPAAVWLVGGALRQRGARIGHSGAAGGTEKVGGGRRGGAGGRGEGLTEGLHLDQFIPVGRHTY